VTTPAPTGYYQDHAASVRGVALRVSRLDADGKPAVGTDCDSYVSTGFISFTFTPEYSEGDEVEIKNAAGEVCVYYKMPDSLKNMTLGLELCDPDPVLTQLLVGGVVLSSVASGDACTPPGAEAGDAVAVGYASEKQGVEANPYGVAIEVWATAVVNGKSAPGCPYWHYLIPYAKMKLDGDRVVENGNLATVFAGTGGGNAAFGSGPNMNLDDVDPVPPQNAFDWDFPTYTDRPFLYARDDLAPVGLNGCFINDGIPLTAVTGGTPGAYVPTNGNTPADLDALIALGPLGNTTAWTAGQYIVLGDNSDAYWDGTEWKVGRAPTPPVVATGATAGTPGAYTPTGAAFPDDLGAMSSVVASPTTAWTTGQYVPLDDASHAHWTGSAWAAGDAT
jgi:hypothetical protein